MFDTDFGAVGVQSSWPARISQSARQGLIRMAITTAQLKTIIERLKELHPVIRGDYGTAVARVQDFLDGDFTPPLQSKWKEAWERGEKSGKEAIYNYHFYGGVLEDVPGERLYDCAIVLVRFVMDRSIRTAAQRDRSSEACKAIARFLESVGEFVADETKDDGADDRFEETRDALSGVSLRLFKYMHGNPNYSDFEDLKHAGIFTKSDISDKGIETAITRLTHALAEIAAPYYMESSTANQRAKLVDKSPSN